MIYESLLASAACLSLLVAVVVCLQALRMYLYQLKAYKALESYEGPVTWPWGGALERIKHFHRLQHMHNENILRYGKKTKTYKILGPLFMTANNGAGNEIVTADPRVVKHILSDHFDTYTKTSMRGSPSSALETWLGHGIFLSDHGPHAQNPADGGKTWLLTRRTALGIFSRTLFRNSYQQVFLEHAEVLLRVLREKDSGEVVDIQNLMFAYTMDCFAESAFGADLKCVEGSNTGFADAFDKGHMAVVKHFQEMWVVAMLCSLLPHFLGGWLLDVFSKVFSKSYANVIAQTAIIDKYIYGIIESKRKNSGTGGKSDLLSLFMELQKDDSSGPLYDDEMLRNTVMNFMLAGRDTTACTLSWTWYELGLPRNAAKLQALLEEVDVSLQGEPPTFEVLQDMPYLRGVVWEVLRLHPIVPFTQLHAKQDDVLPDGTAVPEGTSVSYSTYAMGRDPDRYIDPDVFLPERWIPFEQPSQYEFPVFKGGRRVCIGRDMALFEASLLTARILQYFIPRHVREEDQMSALQKLTVSVFDDVDKKEQLLVTLQKRR